MQQNRHHCVTLYLEDEYEQLALETYFDIWHVDVFIGNKPSFECKFYGNLFKNKIILSSHKMMNLCLNYMGSELLKMYPKMTKVELKELNKLGEKFKKTLPNQSKRTIDDVAKQTTKGLHHQNYRSNHLVYHLQNPYIQRKERYMN